MAKIFDGCVIAVSGSHRGHTQTQIERSVKRNGGVFDKTVDANTTHLVSNEADVAKGSAKVNQAIDANVALVSIDWLLKSLDAGAKEPEAEYALDATAVGSQPSGNKRTANDDADEEEDPVSKKVKAVDGTARPKRKAATPKPADAPTAAAATTRSRRGKSATPAPAVKEEDEDEDSKKVAVGKGRPKKVAVPPTPVKEEEEEEEGNKDSPPEKKKKASAKGKAKVKGKGKAAVKAEDEEEEEEKENVVMKTVVKKGKAPVDELSGLAKTYHVYVDDTGTAWDATLNQTNIGANNNKFYYIQLLEHDAGGKFSVFCHWGRVGEKGQSQFKCTDTALNTAMSNFNKQMKTKSGKYWAERENALGGGKFYAYLERNYEDDDDEGDAIKPLDDGPPVPKAESKISKPLQDLMQLIFNQNYMQQSMASLSYDSKKLPLGKLSKNTIMQGYEALKMIGDVIANPLTATTKYSHYGSNNRDILNQLSSRYYTVIPHDFGRSTPPSIDNPQSLKKETELVENLVDMKISSEIIKDANSNASEVHPIDTQYQSLGLNESEALDRNSTEFKNLEAYVKKTHGKTHGIKLAVEEIFRITRSVEEDRWTEAGWHQHPKDNRKLLWHGSRTTNFGGILSQGLRIAPPEAPVNGYMFDKGIYLADIVSKSANYCCASSSGNTGLLMLCEAQLGDPMLELTHSDYHAAKRCKDSGRLATKGLGQTAPKAWEDASVVHPQLAGISMPKVSGKESTICADLNPKNAWLQYNEYIVYDVSQVKIRYLFRCKFNY